MIAGIIYGLFVGYFVERTNVYYHCKQYPKSIACKKIKEDGLYFEFVLNFF